MPSLRRSVFVRVCAAAIALTTLATPGGAQPPIPPLPRPALDLFPRPAREAVSRVYEHAAARAEDPEAVGALGRMLHAWEQWNLAHDAYLRAQTLAPGAFEWPYLDGIVLQRLARHRDAAAGFRRALEASPDSLAARVKLAEALLDAGELHESGEAFGGLARDPQTEGLGQFGLGRIAAVRGDHTAAVSHLERAVMRAPAWGAAHYALALSYRALGRRADAEAALEKHAQLGPSWPALEDPVLARVTALRDDAVASLRRGLKLADANDVHGAIAAHEDALVRDPGLAQASANLISLYARVHDWAGAEKHYRQVLELGFGLDEAHYNYGVMKGLQEKWAEAAEAYRQAIEVNPRHARAHNNLGQVLERQGDLDGAAAAYTQAVASEPPFRLARFNKARLLASGGRIQEAIGELEKLVEPRDVEAPLYLFALATAYVRSGRKAEGIEWARQASRLASEHGQHALAAAIERDLATVR